MPTCPSRIATCLRWCLIAALAAASTLPAQTPAFTRARHFARGINLSMWWAQSGPVSPERIAELDTLITPADFALIHSLGFDHVRLSINPEPLIPQSSSGAPRTGALRPELLARLDRTVAELRAAGLNVILDIHPEDAWKRTLTDTPDGPEQFFAFWTAFATHFAATDPDHVLFEILNEPVTPDLYRWQGIQARAVARIRAVVPRHTLIATASMWSKIDTLLALEPVVDPNILYTFHQYDPMLFTHQGATWGSQVWVNLRGIPYPTTPENIQPFLAQEPDERLRLELQRLGWDRWNAPRMGAEIAAAAQWAARRNVPLYCGEFGVYRAYAPPADRATWISDTRTALESKHIGWAMWDYQADFGLVTKSPSGTQSAVTVVDEPILHALGLPR